ncbi:MAG: hypothetical protein VZR11_07175 [Succinimonas sp.]|nr:hypothetical protein [Succinimonas sp.]
MTAQKTLRRLTLAFKKSPAFLFDITGNGAIRKFITRFLPVICKVKYVGSIAKRVAFDQQTYGTPVTGSFKPLIRSLSVYRMNGNPAAESSEF